MSLSVFKIVAYISTFSISVPLLIYLARITNLPRQFHLLGLSVVMSAAFDILNLVYFRSHKSNYFLPNLYYILLFALLAGFFYEILFRWQFKKVFQFGNYCFCVVVIVSCFLQDIDLQYQSWVWTISGLILVVFCYLYHSFVQVDSARVVLNQHLDGELAIVAGIFLYFAFSSVIFFSTVNYIMTSLVPDASRLLWSIHNANNVIKNIFFAFGIYYSGKRKITITKQEYDLIVARENKNLKGNPFVN
ncbi:MAG TPA: hypothetical protein VGD65_06770 [Chryseosolibacter sp.]